jgi:hypothetical protein
MEIFIMPNGQSERKQGSMVSALPKASLFYCLNPPFSSSSLCMVFLADSPREVFSSDGYTWPVEVLHSRADSEINDGQSGGL